MSDRRLPLEELPSLTDDDEQEPAPRIALEDLPALDDDEQVPPAPQAPQDHQAPDVPWYEDLLGGAVSAADGVLHNYGGEAGATMAKGMSSLGLERDPQEAEQFVDDASRNYPTAHAAGQMGTDALASLAAPVGKLAQAGIGAVSSGVAEYGKSGDLARTAAATGLGGLSAGVMAGVGGLAGQLGKSVPTGNAVVSKHGGWGSDLIESAVPWIAKKFGVPSWMGQAAKNAVGNARVVKSADGRTTMVEPEMTKPLVDKLARAGGSLGAQISDSISSMFPPEKARGEDKAYATPATYSWAQKAVLSSGHSQLSPEDEQRLGSVLASGDETGLSSLTHQLKQRNPGFARQLERALRAVNGEHE